jgi:hypothetical protein
MYQQSPKYLKLNNDKNIKNYKDALDKIIDNIYD